MSDEELRWSDIELLADLNYRRADAQWDIRQQVQVKFLALQAKARELEERLAATDLEAKLRQVEEERDRARRGNDVLRDEMLRLAAKWEARLQQYAILEQERDQLRARVVEPNVPRGGGGG